MCKPSKFSTTLTRNCVTYDIPHIVYVFVLLNRRTEIIHFDIKILIIAFSSVSFIISSLGWQVDRVFGLFRCQANQSNNVVAAHCCRLLLNDNTNNIRRTSATGLKVPTQH